MKSKIFLAAVSTGVSVSTGLVLSAQAADLRRISSLETFYEAYGAAETYSPEAIATIEGLFDYVAPFIGDAGQQNAAAAGFVPMTKQLKYHGTHWFNPVAYLNTERSATAPTGLNFDENGQLAAVFWPEQKYDIPIEILGQLSTADPDNVPALYKSVKAQTLKAVPGFLNPFGNVNWHSHENVVIENIGTRNPITGAYTEDVVFRQSLTDENFVSEVLTSFASPEKTVGPFEFFPDSSQYPPFDTIADPGFYMVHMWLGLENPDGLFAGTHKSVSPDAPGEHTTFESGGGHGDHGDDHSPGGGKDSPEHVSVPEPSLVLALLTIATFGLLGRRKQIASGNRSPEALL